MSIETKQLLEKLFADVELCYAQSNSFTDEKRAELLAGFQNLKFK